MRGVLPFLAVLPSILLAPVGAASIQFSAADSVTARAEAERAMVGLWHALRMAREDRSPSPETVDEALSTLDESGVRFPGDDFIVGHRIGLRVRVGEWEEALLLAMDCRGTPWWCMALRGLVFHVTDDFGEAEHAFAASMGAMPGWQRCEWVNSLELLIPNPVLEEFLGSDCLGRAALERRIWWMAHPLFLLSANDRRTEHYARLVGIHLYDQVSSLVGQPCGHNPFQFVVSSTRLPESSRPEAILSGRRGAETLPNDPCTRLMRVGWAPEWDDLYEAPTTSEPDRPGLLPAIASTLEPEGYSFLPSEDAFSDPFSSLPSEWAPHFGPGGPTSESYDPTYGPIYELDQQTAFFQRGDSVAVVAGIDLLGHPLRAGPVEIGLILARSELHAPVIVREQVAEPGRHVLRAMVPADGYLVGVEVLRESRGAGRVRFGKTVPARSEGGGSVSDLLLFDWVPGTEADDELDAIVPRILGRTRLTRRQEVGVYFELYGVSEEETVDVTLTLEPVRGFFGRLLSALRVSPPHRIRTGWEEGMELVGLGTARRALRVDLASLTEGEYIFKLTLRTPDGEEVIATSEVEVVR